MLAFTRFSLLVIALGLIGWWCAGAGSAEGENAPAPVQDKSLRNHAIWSVLDHLHVAASKADFNEYFSCYAPNAIFLGTDGTERWTLEEFKTYTKARFDTGKGWTYTPRDRYIFFSDDGRTAWFDEMLDNAKYGECRGSGVLVYGHDGKWRIAQYNLSKPIPNEKMEQVVAIVGAPAPAPAH